MSRYAHRSNTLSMQQALDYRTNRNLFSNYYLDEHLPESAGWNGANESEIGAVFEEIESIFERERPYVKDYNEAELEEDLIKPVLRALDVPFSVQATVAGSGRRPDYAFFESDDARGAALDHRTEGGNFYRDAIAVADAKRWGRPLDTRGAAEYDFENPSYQIHVYLQETPTDWAVLTDGRRWRLYYGPTSHRLDSYYEIDLLTLLETGDREAFTYFYYFFRREAFVPDAGGECFLDEVLEESNVFAQELGEDLQDNIYEAITILSEGFLTHSDNDLDAGDLDTIHDSALVYLYRLIFVFYAESEGRELLPTDNEIYADSYSLNDLKGRVAAQVDSPSPKYRDWQTTLADRLDELFELIDQGSESMGIPEEDLFVPAYNGGLFRTRPEEKEKEGERSREARFLRENRVGDAHLARVIDLLARSRTGNASGGKVFVDYSSLDERHLGSIYEGLLEYRLHVADEPLGIADGEYVPVGESESSGSVEIEVEAGEVYLTTDSGERKATGSYYTPEYVVEYIVENTLGPLVREIREDLLAGDPFGREESGGGFAAEFADRVFDLKVLDPAMGSGHFLVNAIDYLAREIIDAQERQAAQEGIETVAEGRDINWARRQVAQRCIYGVDVNPLATELAKVSLWLRTLAAKQPLAFLDHHLKTGNSLVGSDIEEIDALEAEPTDNGPNATLADFGAVRRGTIDHLMDVYQEFIAIENRELADAKEMERRYQEIERDDLRNRLVAIANVHTAEDFGLDVPGDAYERLARGLSDDGEWSEVSGAEWFQSAQEMADEREFFHWKLEFPEVFYEVNGTEQENPGFDAVIGNPPWIDVKGLDDADLLFDLFETSFNRVNVYAAFFEQSIELMSIQAKFGFVTPNSYMTQSSYRKLRRLLHDELHFDSFVRLPDGVFETVTMETAILVAQKAQVVRRDLTKAIIYASEEDLVTISEESATTKIVDSTRWDGGDVVFDIFTSEPERDVISTIESAPYQVEDLFETCLGLTPYDKHAGHTEEQIESRAFHSTTQESKQCRKITTGAGIKRYRLSWEGGEWIKYGDWLGAPREERFFTQPRCVVRQIVSQSPQSIKSTYAEQEMFHTQVGFVLLPRNSSETEARAITGILNSKLMTFYHQKRFLDENKDTFQKILIQDVKKFPLPEDIKRDELDTSVRQAKSLVEQRSALNTDLLDYLGTYADGQSLAESYQPPAGLADSILTATTEKYEKLKLGRVTVEERGSKLVIRATARYKPANPDAYETDRWDYTETEPEPVMEFVGLSEGEAALIREFVPYAAEEGGGFAGFRENATKTKSILDRLEALTLPAIDDVEGGLKRYLRTKERAEELDEKIERTDELIDQIVYRLYGLNDEEIEIVEESVGR